MGNFLDAALSFPAVLFSFLLVVVVAYWLLVLVGGVEVDGGGGADGVDAGAEAGGFGGFLAGLGLGGVPASVALSLLVALTWFFSLAATVGLDLLAPSGGVRTTLAIVGLLLALLLGLLGTRLIVSPLRRLFPGTVEPSRVDFVGMVCVVRTGSVGPDFGQAEVTAADGSSAIIQVRQTGAESFRAGDKALIFDYEPEREIFWVTPADSALGPGNFLNRISD